MKRKLFIIITVLCVLDVIISFNLKAVTISAPTLVGETPPAVAYFTVLSFYAFDYGIFIPFACAVLEGVKAVVSAIMIKKGEKGRFLPITIISGIQLTAMIIQCFIETGFSNIACLHIEIILLVLIIFIVFVISLFSLIKYDL